MTGAESLTDQEVRQLFVDTYGEAEVQRGEQLAFVRGLFAPFGGTDTGDLESDEPPDTAA